MGEIADLMLDGTMCQGCGVFLCDGEDGPGFPGWCSGCMPAGERPKVRNRNRNKRPRTIACPGCNRMFNTPDALDWHRKAKEH
jgi:hypothetical protein